MNEEIRFIDLFSGIGGFRLGLERANQEDRKQIPCSQNGQKEVRDTGNEFLRANGDNGCSRQPPQKNNSRGLEGAAYSAYEQIANGDTSSRGTGIESKREPQLPASRFRCVWSNDFNKYANQVYTKHFGKENHYSGDIREIDASDIPPHDLICGGFPCQSFSVAGKRKGFTDTRGTLFFEILRIAKHHRPRMLLLENVKGLLSAPLVDEAGDTIPGTHGRVFETILKSLEDMGMWWEYQILNSKDYGVPQNRERVFIIGHSRKGNTTPIFPITETNGVLNEENRKEHESRTRIQGEISPTTDARYGAIRNAGEPYIIDTFNRGIKQGEAYSLKTKPSPTSSAVIAVHPTSPYIQPYPHGKNKGTPKDMPHIRATNGATYNELLVTPVLTPDRAEKRQHGRRFKESGDPSFTLTGQDIHGIYDGMRIRRLTPVECERLQAFPDRWSEWGIDEGGNRVKISDSQRYKTLGNAVTTSVITFLGKRILGAINEEASS